MRLHFRMRSMHIAVAIVAVLITTMNWLYAFKRAWFYVAIILLSTSAFRWSGARIATRIGPTARLAIGWFAAVLGAVSALLGVSAAEQPDHFVRDLPDGLAASALIIGILVATWVEAIFGLAERISSGPVLSPVHRPR